MAINMAQGAGIKNTIKKSHTTAFISLLIFLYLKAGLNSYWKKNTDVDMQQQIFIVFSVFLYITYIHTASQKFSHFWFNIKLNYFKLNPLE